MKYKYELKTPTYLVKSYNNPETSIRQIDIKIFERIKSVKFTIKEFYSNLFLTTSIFQTGTILKFKNSQSDEYPYTIPNPSTDNFSLNLHYSNYSLIDRTYLTDEFDNDPINFDVNASTDNFELVVKRVIFNVTFNLIGYDTSKYPNYTNFLDSTVTIIEKNTGITSITINSLNNASLQNIKLKSGEYKIKFSFKKPNNFGYVMDINTSFVKNTSQNQTININLLEKLRSVKINFTNVSCKGTTTNINDFSFKNNYNGKIYNNSSIIIANGFGPVLLNTENEFTITNFKILNDYSCWLNTENFTIPTDSGGIGTHILKLN